MLRIWTWSIIAALCTASVLCQENVDDQQRGKEEAEVNVSPREVQVQLKQGPIIGYGEPLGKEGRLVYAFKGIPFAEPPVDDLRFMEPVPAGNWVEPRNGSWVANACPQFDMIALIFSDVLKVIGNEDCLYIDVYTPRPYSSDLPVMVYIVAGAYTMGEMAYLTPDPLATKDVVLVTFQFRLGLLGFLSTEDSVLPGNMGMKDQVLALKWIQENIRDLGGDPNKVTLFGGSTGAMSAHFHVLSPKSKGLFQQAILESGNMLCPWALYDKHREAAFKIGRGYNCSTNDSAELLACFKKLPPSQLVYASGAAGVWNHQPMTTLPRVDGDFMPDHPAILLKTGNYNKVPLMAGVTTQEGSTQIYSIQKNKPSIEVLKNNFSVAGPVAVAFREADDDPEYLARRTFYYYVGKPEYTPDDLENFVDMMSDRYIVKHHDDVVDIHARDASYGYDIYTYEFHHRGNFTILKMEGGDNWIGTGEDIIYLMNTAFLNKSQDDLFVSKIMSDMWTNFAKTGNPTPDMSLGFKWEPKSSVGDRRYLSITTVPTMKERNIEEKREFWRSLPTYHNKILYPERFQ